ncbi:MAG: DUF4136 domain-containing protein [bacterium]|nr:DUF4136 domain-containing protein [bacterium]
MSILLCGWLLAGASVAFAGKISVVHDDKTAFSGYVTYELRAGTAARREHVQQRIESDVQRILLTRGLLPATADPDLLVVTHVLVDRQSAESLSDESYWEFVTGVTGVDAYDFGAGTLVIDFVDPASERVVWRGIASEKVDEDVKKVEKKIDKLVERLLRDFPPR